MSLTNTQLGGISAGLDAVTGLGGVISSAIASKRNLQAQRETNQMNYQINQMNNEFNQSMMERQMEYNTEMWNKENEYNSASAQVQRLKAAGLNPALMMGNAGTASTALGVTPAQASSAAPMQAPTLDVRQLADSIQHLASPAATFAQVKQLGAEAEKSSIESSLWKAKTIGEIENMSQDTKSKQLQNAYQSIINQFQRDTYNADVQSALMRPALAKAQLRSMFLSNSEAAIRLSWLPKQLQQAFDLGAADIAYRQQQTRTSKSEEKLNMAKVKSEAQSVVESVARTGLIRSQKEYQDCVNYVKYMVSNFEITQKEFESKAAQENYNILGQEFRKRKTEADYLPSMYQIEASYKSAQSLNGLLEALIPF